MHANASAFRRTAAIHLPDGTSVAVARIEGSEAYKAFMRREAAPPASSSWSSPSAVGRLSRGVLCSSVGAPFRALLMRDGGEGICNNTSSFPSREDDATATEALLRVLKASAVSYLEASTICFADMTLPDPNSAGTTTTTTTYQRSVAEAAIRAVGLRQARPVTVAAGVAALVTNGLNRWDGPRELILAVDHSQYGWTFEVYYRNEGLLELVRRDYRHFSGDGEGGEREREREQRSVWGDRRAVERRALEAIVKSPFGRLPGVGDLPREIGELVLYGDAAAEPGFREDLDAVLSPELAVKAYEFDPVYASAAGMARETFLTVNGWDFVEKPAFGCCWRSGWQGCRPAHGQRVEI